MDYVKGILSGLVAIDLAECVPGPWSAFRGMRQEKQLAWPPSRVELAESLVSPLFWILGGCVQHCFFCGWSTQK
jgi:hypothetical protein